MSNLLSQASLVMIPSGYKEDVVYSPVPTDGSGDLSFTRASNGTRVNSAGLVEVCPWNLLTYSEQFDNAAWIKSSATMTANDAVAPNGTMTADKVVFAGANNFFYQQTSFIGQATASIYVKGTAGQTISIDNTQVITEPLITLTGEWQRITLTSTTSGSSVQGLAISTLQSATARTIYVWGAQLNIGSTAKPYFPTTDRLNVPRLTYQNGGGGCPSLLLEKQSTNVFNYSNTSDWGLSPSITKTQNTTDLLSPDGTYNATKIVQSAGTGDTSQGFSIADGAITFSFWGRVASGTKTLVVDLRNNSGTVASLSPVLTTEWQRFTVTNSTSGTGSSGAVWIYPNGAGTFYIWGVQAEVGSYATSTILTNGASATRVADACYKTGISSLIGQTEGTLFADFNMTTNADSGAYQTIINIATDANNSIDILKNNTTSELYVFAINGGVIQVNSVGIAGTNILGRHKIALAYKSNDYVCYLDGVQVFTDTSASVPACSNLYLGAYLGASNQLGGTIGEAVLFPTRLTNAELASLTTI